ncbi:MAG: hypothetical protein WCJ33_04505, partial [Pseudomonadota bacterium]
VYMKEMEDVIKNQAEEAKKRNAQANSENRDDKPKDDKKESESLLGKLFKNNDKDSEVRKNLDRENQ